MNDVVDLSSYVRRSAPSLSTEQPAVQGWTEGQGTATAGGLNASVLRRLDANSDVGIFVTLVEDLIDHLEAAATALAGRDHLLADNILISAKKIASELLMYRDVSDAAGLVSLKCFQALCEIKAIVDAPEAIDLMTRALRRIWAAPFMSFDEASDLSSMIEDSVGGLTLVGYNELADELIADASISDSA
jgi:hypothetical protein